MTESSNDTGVQAGQSNRLSLETSPYLLQHAGNPVDWYPWCSEALQKAKAEDKPILLSIGYSACHWCHVMAHESFESKEIAGLINEHFIPVKVDREERPDLDEIYMKSVQLMTGQGGWPMTVFLTPDLKPFFGGTYFPPEDRHGLPGFKRVLTALSQAWQQEKDKLQENAGQLTDYINFSSEAESKGVPLDFSIVERSADRLLAVFDQERGGFGGAPKFPQASILSFLMHVASPTGQTSESRARRCRQAISTTLDHMARGGMHDQIGGGFARYAVDANWRIPHFEKMLYDNAALARVYLEGYQLLGKSYWLDVARNTLEFAMRELRTPQGAFYSSLDADSQGEEGKFYVWRAEEIISVLGQADGQWFNDVFGISKIGNFEHGTSVVALSDSVEALSKKYSMNEDEFWQHLKPLKEKLFKARELRVRPGRDEKVLTAWNSLMISALAAGYKVLGDKKYLQAAKKAAGFILSSLYADGRLLRTWGKGRASLNGYLDDYSFFLAALLDLSSVDFDTRWFEMAVEIADTTIKHFFDEAGGGFFYTSDDHERLITRTKNFYDGSTPSGTSVAASSLIKLSALTGVDTYRQKAEQLLLLYAPHAEKASDQFANLLCALCHYLAGSLEILLVANPDNDQWPMLRKIYSFYLPQAVCLLKGSSSQDAPGTHMVPALMKSLLVAGGMVAGQPTVYICHNRACKAAITDIKELSLQLQKLAGKIN